MSLPRRCSHRNNRLLRSEVDDQLVYGFCGGEGNIRGVCTDIVVGNLLGRICRHNRKEGTGTRLGTHVFTGPFVGIGGFLRCRLRNSVENIKKIV